MYNFPPELEKEISAFGSDDAGDLAEEAKLLRWMVWKAINDGKTEQREQLSAIADTIVWDASSE